MENLRDALFHRRLCYEKEGERKIMYTFLLLLIYLAFISLGLPDSLLGSAWPVMHEAFQVPLS